MNSRLLPLLGLACLLAIAWPGLADRVVVKLDASATPELAAWGQQAQPLLEEWYPALCNLLPTRGFIPPRTVYLTLQKSDSGIAATSGDHLVVSSNWIEKHSEDLGVVIHEAVHVVQSYKVNSQGWLTEGIADYLRWAIFEGKPLDWFPVSKKPEGWLEGYRVTAGFLFWLESDLAPGIVKRLNTALRRDAYDPALFKQQTGYTLPELWRKYVQERTKAPSTSTPKG